MVADMVKRVLMIAYHFPPVRGSSGVQRTVALTRYLPAAGWEPIVLTVRKSAYPLVSADDSLIPPGTTVSRSFALDAVRHLSIGGRYPRWVGIPDRWASWWLSAVPRGLALIRRLKPHLIWSTFPIATAHRIGLTLANKSGLPWVADFRDPMTEQDYPQDPRRRVIFQRLEAEVVARASRCVFVTRSVLDMYRQRYPGEPAARMELIPNGFDEEDFLLAAQQIPIRPAPGGPLRIVHSGLLYSEERNPAELFHALAELKRTGSIDALQARIVLRASGYDAQYRATLKALGIEDLVELAPALPYHAALAEMMHADGLVILQAESCNGQIPAKLYEYLRARRPILALTHPKGDTAALLRQLGVGLIGRLDDRHDIKRALSEFLAGIRSGAIGVCTDEQVAAFRRSAQVQEYAQLLDSSVAAPR
jgi:glycosyltransferase involved in cell wall biosynthesis